MSQTTKLEHVIYNNTMGSVTVVVISLFVVFCIIYYMRTTREITDKPNENYIANIGGGGGTDNILNKTKKQCYQDVDCPDGTSCNTDGLCVPRLNNLPLSKDDAKLGLGRQNEKAW